MPLTKLGTRVLQDFKKRYGKDGESRFYAALNAGTISAKKMEQKGGAIRKRQQKKGGK